jgi:hypothetical protein
MDRASACNYLCAATFLCHSVKNSIRNSTPTSLADGELRRVTRTYVSEQLLHTDTQALLDVKALLDSQIQPFVPVLKRFVRPAAALYRVVFTDAQKKSPLSQK